ncbi:MAG: hypothetical protein GY842_29270, partial [bacterium]|nr:hypothetical protein [bacterium]
AFERALNLAPNARLEKIEHTDPHDYSEDAKIDMTVGAQGYVAGDGAVRMFRLPLMSRPLSSMLFPDLSYSVDAEKREHGMRYHATRRLQFEETVKLPAGWKVVHVPEKQTLDSGSAALTFEATPGDGVLSYRFEFIIKHNRITPEDYPELKKAVDTMGEIADELIVCTVEKS